MKYKFPIGSDIYEKADMRILRKRCFCGVFRQRLGKYSACFTVADGRTALLLRLCKMRNSQQNLCERSREAFQNPEHGKMDMIRNVNCFILRRKQFREVLL